MVFISNLPLKTKRRGFLKQVITSKKQRTMKTRIIYVGTLLDLAMMVSPLKSRKHGSEKVKTGTDGIRPFSTVTVLYAGFTFT